MPSPNRKADWAAAAFAICPCDASAFEIATFEARLRHRSHRPVLVVFSNSDPRHQVAANLDGNLANFVQV
jgi:hypothetical protein